MYDGCVAFGVWAEQVARSGNANLVMTMMFVMIVMVLDAGDDDDDVDDYDVDARVT